MHENPYSQSKLSSPFARHPLFELAGEAAGRR